MIQAIFVNGVDRRQRIPKHQAWDFPYNCIGLVEFRGPQGKKTFANGILISKSLLVVAAQSLVSFDQQKIHYFKPENVYFSPLGYLDKQLANSEVSIPVQKFVNNRAYQECLRKLIQTKQRIRQLQMKPEANKKKIWQLKKQYQRLSTSIIRYDFALIQLKKPALRSQYFHLKQLFDKRERTNVTVSGYISQSRYFQLLQHSNQIHVQAQGLGVYDIDVGVGQSGSPVYITKNNRQVVAINTGYNPIFGLNCCCLVTYGLLETLQSWVQELQLIFEVNLLDKLNPLAQYLRQQQGFQSKHLNLSAKACQYLKLTSGYKLTSYDMQILIKADLSNLESLNLQGNNLRNKRLFQLFQKHFKNLKQVYFNDNGFTVAEVLFLIMQDQGDKSIIYHLDTAKSNDGSILLGVGQNVRIIKSLIRKPSEIRHRSIDNLSSKNKKQLYEALHLMSQIPFEGNLNQCEHQSKRLEQQMKKKLNENYLSIEQVLLAIKKQLKGAKVTFSQKSNIKSKLSMKIITTGMQTQRVMLKHVIKDTKWQFKDLQNNCQLTMNFQKWYLQKLQQEYKADIKDVSIHKLAEGSLQVYLSVSGNNQLLKNPRFVKNQIVSVVPFFDSFNLSIEDFDYERTYDFPEYQATEPNWRGGLPYFQPIYGKRFAINILNLYDNGNNDWISMQSIAGQWSVAFHGIRYPSEIVPSNNMTILQSIMSERQRGQMLRGGGAQYYQDKDAVNKVNQKVGWGIYFSPLFTTCLFDYTEQVTRGQQTFHVVLQSRIKPGSLKCTSEDTYWVVNQSKDVRPYGIILFSTKQVQILNQLNYIKRNGIYTQPWDWESWKQQYISFRQYHGLPL